MRSARPVSIRLLTERPGASGVRRPRARWTCSPIRKGSSCNGIDRRRCRYHAARRNVLEVRGTTLHLSDLSHSIALSPPTVRTRLSKALWHGLNRVLVNHLDRVLVNHLNSVVSNSSIWLSCLFGGSREPL